MNAPEAVLAFHALPSAAKTAVVNMLTARAAKGAGKAASVVTAQTALSALTGTTKSAAHLALTALEDNLPLITPITSGSGGW